MAEYKERIVRDGELTSTRSKSKIYLRVMFREPVMCKIDGYIKEKCLHAERPAEGSKCYQCIQEHPTCLFAHALHHGGLCKFTPSKVNAEKRAARKAKREKEIATRERIKASRKKPRRK